MRAVWNHGGGGGGGRGRRGCVTQERVIEYKDANQKILLDVRLPQGIDYTLSDPSVIP